MFKYLFSVLSPAGARGRLSTLIFHRVLPRPDTLMPSEPDAKMFDRMLCWVGSWFNVLPLEEAIERLQNGSLPPRALAITFDDGYADNCEVALPILQRHGMHATFFVATGFLDGGRMWNDTVIETVRACDTPEWDLEDLGLGRYVLRSDADRIACIDALLGKLKYLDPVLRLEQVEAVAARISKPSTRQLMMRSDQVKVLHDAGMSVGAHTVNHPILASIEGGKAEAEMAESRDRLKEITDSAITLFAYPNGRPHQDYRSEHVALARKLGFKCAVSTAWGVATSFSDPYQIPRFTPWDRSRVRFGLRLAQNFGNAASDMV